MLLLASSRTGWLLEAREVASGTVVRIVVMICYCSGNTSTSSLQVTLLHKNEGGI